MCPIFAQLSTRECNVEMSNVVTDNISQVKIPGLLVLSITPYSSFRAWLVSVLGVMYTAVRTTDVNSLWT